MLVVLLQNIRIYTLKIFKIDDIKKIRKNIKPHSAKLKMKLQLTSAQVGPPLYAFAMPPKKPKYSICVSNGMPHPIGKLLISSWLKF